MALHDSPVTASIEAIRGYVLLATPDHVHVYKVTSTGLHEVITDYLGNLAQNPAEVILDSSRLVNNMCPISIPNEGSIGRTLLFAQRFVHWLTKDSLAECRNNIRRLAWQHHATTLYCLIWVKA